MTHITIERARLKLALEALKLNNDEWKSLADSGDCGRWKAEDQDHYKQTNEAIAAVEQALAAQHEPENEPFVSLASVQEPVAWPVGSAEYHRSLLVMGKALAWQRSREIGDAWNQLANLLTVLEKARSATPPAQPAPVTLITFEQHIALREAFAINSADLYFEANPTHDNDVGRMLFERGFARGFDSHERAIETAKKGNT